MKTRTKNDMAKRVMAAFLIMTLFAAVLPLSAHAAVNQTLLSQVYSESYSGVHSTPSDMSGNTEIHYYPNGGSLNSSCSYLTSAQKSEYSANGYMTLRQLCDPFGSFIIGEFVDDVFLKGFGTRYPYIRSGYNFKGWSFDPAGNVMVTSSSPSYTVEYRSAGTWSGAEYAVGTPVLINRSTYQGVNFGDQSEQTASAIVKKYLPIMVENFNGSGNFRIWAYDTDIKASRTINLYAQWEQTTTPCTTSIVLNYPLPGETFGTGYLGNKGTGSEMEAKVSTDGHALSTNLWSGIPANGKIISSTDIVQTDVMYYTTISAWPKSGYSWGSSSTYVEVKCKPYPGAAAHTDGWDTDFTSYDGKYHTLDMFMFNSINYSLDGGTISSESGTYPTYILYYGATMQLSALPHAVKAGYKFLGWEDSSGTLINPDTTTKTLTTEGGETPYCFTAKWEKIPTSTITFYANDGSGRTAAQTVNSYVATALSANTFTRRGYTFTKWSTSPDGSGTGYADRASITASNDLSLYAQWAPAPDYTVIIPDGANISIDKDTGVGTGEIGIAAGSVIPEDKTLRISLNAGQHYSDSAKTYQMQNTTGGQLLGYQVSYKGHSVNPNSSNAKALLETVDADAVYSGFTGNIAVQVGLPKTAGLYKDVLTFSFSVS